MVSTEEGPRELEAQDLGYMRAMLQHDVVQTYLEKNPPGAVTPIRSPFRSIVSHKQGCILSGGLGVSVPWELGVAGLRAQPAPPTIPPPPTVAPPTSPPPPAAPQTCAPATLQPAAPQAAPPPVPLTFATLTPQPARPSPTPGPTDAGGSAYVGSSASDSSDSEYACTVLTSTVAEDSSWVSLLLQSVLDLARSSLPTMDYVLGINACMMLSPHLIHEGESWTASVSESLAVI